ncbi:MAG: epoxyqueuosine reductase QueH [Hungatella sp.]
MEQKNYQKELDRIIERQTAQHRIPTLLLHSCCAPCSSYVLEYLSSYFNITVYYYNPNIYPIQEYLKRAQDQEMLIEKMTFQNPVEFVSGRYDPESFRMAAKGLEQEPEGGARCFKCYEMRLRETAKVALAGQYDYFTTTLSISPLKSAEKLNEIGERIGIEYGVTYLPSDFKKREGYKRSLELSKEYGLYRQNYCGCVYSFPEIDR